MLTGLVLICSLAGTPDIRVCSRNNAAMVMRIPADCVHPVPCFMHGQAFLLAISIGQELSESERIKVICVATQTVGASIRVLD